MRRRCRVTKHTVMAWNGARILVEVVEVDRANDDCDMVMSTVHRLQRELHEKHDDPRWQTWPGEAAVEARCAVAPKPVDAIDYDAVREIAETADADLDAMEYLEPCEARDLCRELLRLRQTHGGAQ